MTTPAVPPCAFPKCQERVEYRGGSASYEMGVEIVQHRWRCEGGHEFTTEDREKL